MGQTQPATLVVAALAAAALAWMLISHYYSQMYDLTWIPPVMLTALAAGESLAARQTAARIAQKPGAGPLNPLMVARFVALAKASALAGAIFTGFYGGLSIWLGFQRGALVHAQNDLPKAIAGAVASLLLTAAALWLERSCKAPPPPDEDLEPGEEA
jgi:hypothetical protein